MLGLGLTEVLLLLVVGVYLIIQYGKPKKNLPPGPLSLPLLGNIFQMMTDAHLKMTEWAKKYGKMYTLRLGNQTAIVISDVKLLRELLSDSNYSARPHSPLLELLTAGPYGIISTNGKTWEEQRRWSLRKLRDFGFGKTSMEGMIMDEVNEMADIIKKNGTTPMQINKVVDVAVLNALWTITTGNRLKQTDPVVRDLLDAHHQIPQVFSQSGLMFVPWLKYIFPNSQNIVEVAAEKTMKFSQDAVTEHFETYQDGVSRDFIDEYIGEIKKTKDQASSFYGDYGRKNLDATVSDLIQAGSETTSNTMSWLFCYLTEFPEVQKKVHEEIDRVVGLSKQIGMTDKANLPYTEAAIMETLRVSSLIAGGLQRCAVEEREVEGYTIPKDCWILSNIYYIHHDPAVWGDPENFRPERFLSPDGKKVVRHEALIPFQVGRRQCLGESLAKDNLFLFTANLFQQFSVKRMEKEYPQAETGGIFLMPKNYHFIFTPRVK